MEDSSRRSVLKAGFAGIAGLFGAGVATAVGRGSGPPRAKPSVKTETITLHGSQWHVVSPNRRSGEFPDAGEQMLLRGILAEHAGGDQVGNFYATYFGLAPIGWVPSDGAASLQTHTFQLPGGTIVGTGTATPGHTTEDEFAIVGGTGKYAGARGTYSGRQSPLQFGGDGTAVFTMTLTTEGDTNGR